MINKYESVFYNNIMSLLTEIWQLIMLDSPEVYCILTRTCSRFKINQSVAKQAMVIISQEDSKTEYKLPNGWQHREDGPAVIWANGRKHGI